MRSATEVARVNYTYGANVFAHTTASALIVVDNGKVVNHGDSTAGAGFLAFLASDTAVIAILTHLCTLGVAVTLNDDSFGVLNEVNNAVGAGLGTKSAANTLAGINLCNTLLGNADSVSRTYLYTVAVAKAGKGAEAVARIAHICRFTGPGTLVNILSFLGVAGAVAGNVSHLLNNVCRVNAHNFANSFGNAVTAGGTKAYVVGLSLGKSLGIAVASRISAGAAVSAGKAVAYFCHALVLLNSKEGGGEGEKQCAKNRDAEKHKYRN